MSAVADRLRLSEAQQFGARFFAFLIGASILSWAVSLPTHLSLPQQFIAQSATRLAQLAGSSGLAVRDQIAVGGVLIDVNYECTGLYVLMILFTFLLAYPASWVARLAGATIGLVGLTVINILRISVLIGIAEWQPDLFAYFHEYIWQGVFLILVIAYAMTWVEYVQ